MSKRKPAGMSPATYLRIVLLMAVVVGALLWLSRRSWVLPSSGGGATVWNPDRLRRLMLSVQIVCRGWRCPPVPVAIS